MSDVPPTPPPPGSPPPWQPPSGPPTAPVPPTGPPTYQPPTQAQPPVYGQPQPGYGQPQPEQKKSRAGLVVALVVLVLLVAGAAVGAWYVLSGGAADVSIDSCVIEADGTLSASGEVDGLGGDQRVEVRFSDAADGSQVDVDPDAASSDGPWQARGSAGDQVQRVECTATVVDG